MLLGGPLPVTSLICCRLLPFGGQDISDVRTGMLAVDRGLSEMYALAFQFPKAMCPGVIDIAVRIPPELIDEETFQISLFRYANSMDEPPPKW
jgi:hypothetical protein